ncbi:unnamed protein product [Cylicocyclus nassatus]|uniref:FERM domain-containing protein n=1 Tax=Cylicocyclus nassatus TaxID=53992 RepID=A0AA36GIQ4_CYLNA|nr:unnamed protein product [Cylicocyclus nassatus]
MKSVINMTSAISFLLSAPCLPALLSYTLFPYLGRTLPSQAILDYICELKNIREKDYLGLRYQDHNKHRYWVDLSRPISHIAKQFKSDSLALRLRFRYYPAEPSHLREDVSRYQLFMQLQRDLLHGRLYCPQNQSAELAALILQAQLGDCNEAIHTGNYVSQYKLLLKQTPRIEEKIAEIHKSLSGKSTSAAELEFLEKASKLDTYGFDPYTVKDPKDPNHAVYIGVTHKGILIYQASQKVHHIPWSQLSKVDYVGKELYIYPTEAYVPPTINGTIDDGVNNKHKDRKSRLVLKYQCPSGTFAKHLWNHILSQQAFFNEQSALMIKPKFSKPRIPLLSRGSTFRFPSRRVLREIESTDIASDSELNTNGPAFVRFELPRQEPRKEQPWLIEQPAWLKQYHTLPNLKVNHNNNEVKVEQKSPVVEFTTITTTVSNSKSAPLDLQASPAPSSPVQDFPSTSSVHDDKTPSHDQTPTTATTMPDYKPWKNENVPEPDESLKANIQGDTLEVPSASVSQPLLESNAEENQVNGTASNVSKNGSLQLVEHTNNITQRSSAGQRCANVFFSTFLILLLLLAMSIALFERNDTSDWIENTAWLSHVRHSYYEPARHVLLDKYHTFFLR